MVLISMKGFNFLAFVEGKEIVLIMLNSASFFHRASNVIINGGVFSVIRSDGSVVVRQTGE